VHTLPSAPNPSRPPQVPTIAPPLRAHVSIVPWIADAIALVWISGASFLLIRLVASLLYLERLKRDALPFPVELRARLSRWNAATKGSREVRLCISDSIGVPVAIGLFDALILVPKDLVELDPSEIDCVLLHELAHLRRGDDWINAVQRAVAAVLFFSPAIAYACSRLDVEREVACDDAVLVKIDEPLVYANCLARMTEAAAWPAREVAAPGIFSTRRGMSLRIERLLDSSRDSRVRMVGMPLVVAAIAVATACILGAYGAPSFTDSPSPVASALHFSDQPAGQSRLIYSGNWKIEASARPGFVNFGIDYPASMSASSHDMPLNQVGLTSRALGGASRTITFDFKTESGTFVCHGKVSKGQGTGTFTFVPDDAYANAYDAIRSQPLTPRQRVQAGMFDLRISYVRGVVAAGFGDITFEALDNFKNFGITPEFLRILHSDFPTIDSSGVMDAAMASLPSDIDLHALHLELPNEDLDAVIALAMAGVTPRYINALRAAGVRGLSADSVVEMNAHGVDQAFADRLATKGPHGLSVDEVVRLANATR